MPSQPGPSNWQSQMSAQSATPYWQPAFPSNPGGYNWQSPIPSHMGNPNLQPLLRGITMLLAYLTRNAFDDENEGGDDVIFLGGEFTGYLVHENVDPQKGYLVPVTFWQQLVPHLCMPDIDSRTPMGWLSGE
nr:hypothetical protein [Tanacetum cinerariifolium]